MAQHTPPPAGPRYDLLDQAMDDRRLELGLRWKDVAVRAGTSEQALRDIRRGRSFPRDLTIRRLEETLGWAPGSVRAVLDGGEPEVAAAQVDHSGSSVPTEEGLSWTIQDGYPVYHLTRMIRGNPVTVSQVVRDQRSREQIERELNQLMDMAVVIWRD
ncbi:transcriptional regulator with XRE-family HTH domain [Nocardiopsis mwathae]|uniref:Transcriptional regulator with XRE-family HTH domain n=1 Tax=Nocardiopsis mwathae TaxID=1472723 RepID=A0A7X0D868_9ACTN|nr:helix-turn-helix transcriptional regulator [Nocardiopsis mwathae]MBB6173704.1 transcriptional regulator with XRE-family HTH domain [Nocardiopsis mwathae]